MRGSSARGAEANVRRSEDLLPFQLVGIAEYENARRARSARSVRPFNVAFKLASGDYSVRQIDVVALASRRLTRGDLAGMSCAWRVLLAQTYGRSIRNSKYCFARESTVLALEFLRSCASLSACGGASGASAPTVTVSPQHVDEFMRTSLQIAKSRRNGAAFTKALILEQSLMLVARNEPESALEILREQLGSSIAVRHPLLYWFHAAVSIETRRAGGTQSDVNELELLHGDEDVRSVSLTRHDLSRPALSLCAILNAKGVKSAAPLRPACMFCLISNGCGLKVDDIAAWTCANSSVWDREEDDYCGHENGDETNGRHDLKRRKVDSHCDPQEELNVTCNDDMDDAELFAVRLAVVEGAMVSERWSSSFTRSSSSESRSLLWMGSGTEDGERVRRVRLVRWLATQVLDRDCAAQSAFDVLANTFSSQQLRAKHAIPPMLARIDAYGGGHRHIHRASMWHTNANGNPAPRSAAGRVERERAVAAWEELARVVRAVDEDVLAELRGEHWARHRRARVWPMRFFSHTVLRHDAQFEPSLLRAKRDVTRLFGPTQHRNIARLIDSQATRCGQQT